MGGITDRFLGFLLFVFAVSAYFYYVIWVLITPFIDEDHPIQNYFPSREYAIGIPLVLMTFVILVTTSVLGYVMIKSSTKTSQNKTKTQ
jgi:dolichyl-phosphate mannosyltransferase polypeptide 2 regulatory subunit